MSRRKDYYDDPNAPKANSLKPGGSALVFDDEGRLLLQRRADNDDWAVPGGVMDLGESLPDAVVREVKEESGLDVEITGLVGIYTDPKHVMAYADGEVRQEFNVAFTARIVGGELRRSDESTDIGFFELSQLDTLPMHWTHRRRIEDYRRNEGAHIG